MTMMRRGFLAGAGAGLGYAVLDGDPARAQPKPVWRHYAQEELDRNYDQSAWAPNMRQLITRYGFKSELTRKRLGPPSRLSYGETAIETMSFYRSPSAKSPVHVFIHGGAWRAGPASIYEFPAEMFVASGVGYAALDFGNVQDIGLDGMVAQIRRALVWVSRNADRMGVDPERIYVSGHSSGAHLASVAAITDWTAFGAPANLIKGAVLASGLYDLEAPRLSARASYVKFTDEIERLYSAARHVEAINAPLILAYGTLETHEFMRQTKEFAGLLERAGKPHQLLVGEGYNHFEIMDDLGNPFGLLGAAALKQSLGG